MPRKNKIAGPSGWFFLFHLQMQSARDMRTGFEDNNNILLKLAIYFNSTAITVNCWRVNGHVAAGTVSVLQNCVYRLRRKEEWLDAGGTACKCSILGCAQVLTTKMGRRQP